MEQAIKSAMAATREQSSDGKQTGGAFSQLEQLCSKASGPPPHPHTQTENFYILDGEITFSIDGQTLVGKKELVCDCATRNGTQLSSR